MSALFNLFTCAFCFLFVLPTLPSLSSLTHVLNVKRTSSVEKGEQLGLGILTAFGAGFQII